MAPNQGSSGRLVFPVILGKRRAWREIQNLYMRFVILKVRNPLLCKYCFKGTPLYYRAFAWIVGLTNLAQQTLVVTITYVTMGNFRIE